MKWIKWLLIIFFGTVLCLIVAGRFVFPEFTADSLNKIKKHFKPDQTSYSISESNLPDSKEYKVKPLDKPQIQKMVKQLIPAALGSEGKKEKVVISSANKEIMKDIQEFLHDELPKGWTISRSTSEVDAVVTGNLFTLTPEKPTPTPIEDELPIEEVIEDELPIEEVNGNLPPGRPKLYSPKIFLNGDENRNFPPEPQIESKQKQRLVLFLYWITETKEILSATANFENPNITAASEDFTKNLTVKNLSESVKSLKVALINTKTDSATSRLVTASVLEEMVNAETGMTFLDKSNIGKHNTELKQALRSDDRHKVSLEHLAKKFSKSTEASAALVIYQPSQKHFDLELLELPSLNILAIGRSENQPME